MTTKTIETFWNGRETEATKTLAVDSPTDVITENKAVNANIALNCIYYDVYNNGGYNLISQFHSIPRLQGWVDAILEANVGTKFGKINLLNQLETIKRHLIKQNDDGEYVEIEEFYHELKNALAKENLDFPVYPVYIHNNPDLITLDVEKATGDGWMTLNYGCEENRDERMKQDFRKLI